ncbi:MULTISPECIES: phage tail protein [Oligella]|uniref:phage tail protein n=1 Tax=Oligella TaxID=90243 RepID=UPI0006605472|nr:MULTISPECIES: phage tail protein [Oligella]OFV49693.1 hypothetical protein HMPREF3179_03540 [Oligella sp. HMSC09E12]
MQTFQTVIDFNPEVEFAYNDLSQSFSDKTAKVTIQTGINAVSQRWNITVSGRISKVKEAQNFVLSHLGSRRFRWRTPVGEDLYFRCIESTLNFHSPVTAKLSLVLEQVFVP